MDIDNDSQIAYIYSNNLVNQLNKITKISKRANLVNSLINAYDLFKYVKVINPIEANDQMLTSFHSNNYIQFIKKYSNIKDIEKIIIDNNDENENYGIGYDCPAINDLYEFCCTVAGGSLSAAQLINSNKFKYVVNWHGGFHHAKKDKASGYCYINDIVLCILKLRQRFNRILYIDFDLHHGDGVQDAFEFTNKIMTLSFHKFSPGFFPGTGGIDEIGQGNGKYYTLNVPLYSGIDDSTYYYMFSTLMKEINEIYKPEVIVCQCGADSLYGDPCDSKNPFNLTVNGYSKCIETLIDYKLPIIFLGGGGYNFANTARLWCKIVSLLTKVELNNDIPEHEYFLEYAPYYELNTQKSTIKNKNSNEYVNNVLNTLICNLRKCVTE